MQSITLIRCVICTLLISIIISGCADRQETAQSPTVQTERIIYPTPASTLEELIANLANDDPLVIIVSTHELQNYDPDAVAVALPLMVENLHHTFKSTAYILGWLGTRAQQAVPDLMLALENDENSIHVRVATAWALGKIGDITAVPTLAHRLYGDSDYDTYNLEIACANSIALITGQEFREVGSTLDADGVPLIVIDARNWWEKEGKYLDWQP